jgi:hypothetical protein
MSKEKVLKYILMLIAIAFWGWNILFFSPSVCVSIAMGEKVSLLNVVWLVASIATIFCILYSDFTREMVGVLWIFVAFAGTFIVLPALDYVKFISLPLPSYLNASEYIVMSDFNMLLPVAGGVAFIFMLIPSTMD